MKSTKLELTSRTINRAEFDAYLNRIQDYLVSIECGVVKVAWGWGCNLELEELWIYREISVELLHDYISKASLENVFIPNEADVFVQSINGEFEFTLSHEADIHFETTDPDLFRRVRQVWQDWDLKGYLKTGGEWQELDRPD